MMAPMMARMGGAGGPSPFGGLRDPTADTLQTTLDDKAPAAQVKEALARFRDAKKQKQAELTKSRDTLKELLPTRQEAALAMAGILEQLERVSARHRPARNGFNLAGLGAC